MCQAPLANQEGSIRRVRSWLAISGAWHVASHDAPSANAVESGSVFCHKAPALRFTTSAGQMRNSATRYEPLW